jgi:hypothetical protein
MKQIGIVILVFSAIGCWLPATVRAEAPIPRNGCLSREIAIAPIADRLPTATISGRVVGIEHNDRDRSIAAKEVVTWVRVKTSTGEVKSIYLGADRSLDQQHIGIKIGDMLEIQGVQMLKAKQPTIVANTLRRGDRTWKIANFTDKQIGVKSCRYNG